MFLSWLIDKQVFVTFLNDYEKTVEEKELEDKFIIFRPYVVYFTSDKFLTVKPRELTKKLQKFFKMDAVYTTIFRKKGFIIFNENKMDKTVISELLEKKELKFNRFTLSINKLSLEECKKWVG